MTLATDNPQCSEATARALTDQLRQSLTIAWDLLVEAYQRRAWAALGYQSWDAYTDAELGEARLRLPREQRREVVASMTEAGMSTRAIGSALGINEATVSRDRRAPVADATPDKPIEADDLGDRIARELAASDEQYAEQATAPDPEPEPKPQPARVLGTDGKTYPAPKPPAPSPAVTDWLDSSPAVQDSGYLRAYTAAAARADDFLSFDAARLAPLLDPVDVEMLDRFADRVSRFADTIRRGRSGLRVINGGQ